MLPHLTAFAQQLAESGNCAVARELPVRRRVVDLAVASVGNLTNLAVASRLRRLTLVQLDLLGFFISSQAVSIQKLSRRTYLTSSQLHRMIIEPALSLGLIAKKSRYRYQATEWVLMLPTKIVAVEAKLERLNEVLEQAVYNAQFADLSYVALDVRRIDLSPSRLEMFSNEGIGVIGVRSDGCRILVEAKASKPVSALRGLQLVRVLRDLVGGGAKWQLAH